MAEEHHVDGPLDRHAASAQGCDVLRADQSNGQGAIATFSRLLRRVPRGRIVVLGLLMVLASASEGIGLLLLVPLVEQVGGGTMAPGPVRSMMESVAALGIPLGLGGLLGLFVGLVALRSIIQFAREQLGMRIERHLIDGLRGRAYAALLRAEWRWLAHSRRSDHAHILLSNIDRLGAGLSYGITLIALLVTIVAYAAVAVALSPMMTLVVGLTGALVFAALSRQRRQALAMGERLSKAKRAMFAAVDQSLVGLKLSKILGNEARHIDHFNREMAELREQGFAYATSLNLSRALFQLGAAALLALYLYLGLTVWRVAVPELLTLVLLFARVVPMLMSVQQTVFVWLHAMPAVHEVETLLDDTRAAAEPASGDPATDDGPPWTLDDGLRLDAVSLHWAERDRPALEGLTLVMPARTTLAVIGASGSGKSTLADIVMGLLVPDSGTLSVDGRAVCGAGRIGWRRAVAYVPQEVFLFHDSIRANLAWGLDDAGDSRANEAAMADALRSAAADFVFALPHGLDTIVGDGGVRLSGGERQRIALARALLRRPSLLILDEATSALDIENELRIRDAIERLHGRLTVIVIGHRLPTLDHADQVIRMSEGRIVARGSWAEVGGMAA